ncbi:LysR family transcriptional regulator, partial [Bacillus subtilis]|nr:LysR family transcriptional regulator [Bacillus subtilis]
MIARLGSVSRAAEELNLTQPAVSLQVRLLEEAVGAALLQRVGRGVQLTAAGEIVARYAREILHLWSEAGDEVAALTGDLGGTLRIGAITTAEYLIPPLLVKFTATRPHVKTYFKVGNRDDIIRMLATHEIDLAVMGSAPKELRTHAVEFAKHPMVFVAAPGHPLM